MPTITAAFLLALATAESGNDPFVVNKAEDAVGLYQLRPIFVKDVNRIINMEYFALSDRYSPQWSEIMVIKYLEHYATTKRLGHEATNQDLAALRCAGPDGYTQKDEPKVKEHWEKVKAVLEKQKQK